MTPQGGVDAPQVMSEPSQEERRHCQGDAWALSDNGNKGLHEMRMSPGISHWEGKDWDPSASQRRRSWSSRNGFPTVLTMSERLELRL